MPGTRPGMTKAERCHAMTVKLASDFLMDDENVMAGLGPTIHVIPAKAGIQDRTHRAFALDSGFRRNDALGWRGTPYATRRYASK